MKGTKMKHGNRGLQQLLHPVSGALVASEHGASVTFLIADVCIIR